MNTIYKSAFSQIDYDVENSIFENRWLDSKQLTAAIFKEEMLQYVKLVKEHLPHNFLVDNHDNEYAIPVEVQEWVNVHVFPNTMHAKVNKIALVVPDDIFAQVSLEQTVEDGEGIIGRVPTQYFTTKDAALKWLIKK